MAPYRFFWIDQHTSFWLIAIVLFVRGIGAGGILMPLMADSYTGMKTNQVPAATIGARIIQNIGSAFGSAIITTAVTAYSASRVKTFETKLAAGKFNVAANHLQSFTHQHLVDIRLESFQYGFLIISIAALIIILPTILLSNKLKKILNKIRSCDK